MTTRPSAWHSGHSIQQEAVRGDWLRRNVENSSLLNEALFRWEALLSLVGGLFLVTTMFGLIKVLADGNSPNVFTFFTATIMLVTSVGLSRITKNRKAKRDAADRGALEDIDMWIKNRYGLENVNFHDSFARIVEGQHVELDGASLEPQLICRGNSIIVANAYGEMPRV